MPKKKAPDIPADRADLFPVPPVVGRAGIPARAPAAPESKSLQKYLAPTKSPAHPPRAARSKTPVSRGAAGAPPEAPPQEPGPMVVGIGASAGGLEAFTQFLELLPADTGMGFVLVQHMAPRAHSMLPEILAKVTPLPVTEVQDGMPVEPDHIYVTPPDIDMSLAKGILRLQPRVQPRGLHRPVDSFLTSLAADRGSRAIGVILSGTASDGVQGMKAIKEAGGITFAQAVETAKYSGMPESAIAAGCVDFVLSPAKIARELVRLARHPLVRPALLIPTPEVPPEEANDFLRILGLLNRGTGVDFAQYKQNTIKRRLLRRMMLDGFDKLGDYARHLAENPREVQKVYEDILINVTGFFREPEAFEALQKVVFPAILQNRPAGDPIRVWIPGCATGEEAYSIAICLVEFLGDMAANMPIQIFATDVEDAVIDRARNGVYPESVAADLSPERLRRFFVKLASSYQVSKTIRDMCVFARQNLVKDPPFSRLDLISCRNVLIYFGPVLQQRVIPIFHFALKPNGFLLLGKSEALGPFTDFFTLVDHKNKIYTRRPMPVHAVLPAFAAGPGVLPGLAPQVKPPEKADRGADLLQEADRLVLARYAPAGIIIDEEMKILHFRGHTGPYLEPAPGEASLQLLKMAREGLGMDLRAAVRAAIQGNSPVRREGVQLRHNGSVRRINLEVLPLRSSAAAALPRYFLVLFEDVTPASAAPEAAQAHPKHKGVRGKRAALDDELRGLQNELAATKEYLQSVIEDKETGFEELKSTNEELLSANEELQSINEEMETSKEELQSANEELSTLNEEVENRNQELAQANNDLTNLLTAVQIAIIILGPDLRIRRFNPAAQEMLSLIPSDQGRPLGDLKLGIDIPDLEALVKEVLETLAVKELEVRDPDKRWYSLRIRPYRTAAHKIDGVVITLVDINTLKCSLEEVRGARNFAQAVVETCREALLVLDGTLRVVSVNESFCRLFQVTPPETLNRLIYELGDRQWDSPDLRRLLEEILPKNTVLQDYLVEHAFPKLGFRSMVLNARRLRQEDTGGELILLAMEDVTVRRQAEDALKESEQKLRALNAELMIAQEYERQAVSLALHEELAQDLSAMKLRLRQAEKKLPAAAGEAKEELDAILESVAVMINGIRELSRGLRPDVLDLGLTPAIQHLLNQFSQYFQIDATIKVPDLDGLFFPQTQVMLYRILQEALVNVVKHAQATKVSVVIATVDSKVSFVVADNGQGLRPERSIYKDMGKELGLKQEPAWLVGGVPFVMSENGKDFRLVEQSSPHYTPKKMGLVVMEERVRLLGGTLEITSRENAGARLAFTIPPEKQKV